MRCPEQILISLSQNSPFNTTPNVLLSLLCHPVISPCSSTLKYTNWLKDILHTFTQEERSLFLLYVTSCPRAPLFGFGSLMPKLAMNVSN